MNFRRIIVYVTVLGMIMGAFALEGEAGAGETDRHMIITVTGIAVQHIPQDVVEGIYRNGNFRLNVSFRFAQAVNQVNVTWNVTHVATGNSEIITIHIGNLNAGNHSSLDNHYFNFGTVGDYQVNATVWGNHNNSNISTSLMNTFRFENLARYELHFENTGWMQAKTGEYANNTLMTITGNVTNIGNYDIQNTNITISIIGPGGSEPVDQPWNNPFGLLMVNDTIDNVQFNWRPEIEGDYEVNITVTEMYTKQSNSTNFSVRVRDVVDINVGEIRHEESVMVDDEFEVTAFLNNTGNVEANVVVNITILDSRNVTVYWTNNNLSIAPHETSSITFYNITILHEGLYTVRINAEQYCQNESDLVVLHGFHPLMWLEGETFVPNPWVENVHADDIITFYVNYSDKNNDSGIVTLVVDNEEYEMILSDGVGDTWDTVETFEYEWTAIEGNHNFYFNFTDGLSEETYAPLHPDFKVYPQTGMLYGKVTDSRTGKNISGAKIVLYSTFLNATNVIKIDTYYNLTADENGSYMKELPFSDWKYVLLVDELWMEANDYGDPSPAISIFWMNANNMEVWKNFTLGDPDHKWPARLNVTVVDQKAIYLPGVTITVEIFKDEPGETIVQKYINGTLENVTVLVTTRTWMNFTGTTGENGSCSIWGIPFDKPYNLDITGRKIFRHDHKEPDTAPEGYWCVIASKDGYETKEKWLEFREGKTTYWNLILEEKAVKYGNILGIVDPPYASISIDPEKMVEHNKTTGDFLITELEDGNYTLNFSAPGYIDKIIEITIIDGRNYSIGKISLINGPPLPTYFVIMGPFTDANGENVQDITITFTCENVTYCSMTGSDGIAYFEMRDPPGNLYGTEITIEKGSKERRWIWNVDEAPLINPFSDEEDEEKADRGRNDSTILIILISIGIIIVTIGVGIVVWISIFRKKTPDIPEETSSCDHACPYCAAPAPPRVTYCPVCGEEFSCAECGHPTALGALRCGGCGSVLRGESSKELEENEEDEMGRVKQGE